MTPLVDLTDEASEYFKMWGELGENPVRTQALWTVKKLRNNPDDVIIFKFDQTPRVLHYAESRNLGVQTMRAYDRGKNYKPTSAYLLARIRPEK